MLTVHAPNATSFTATGLGLLDPHIIEARVVEELDGQYALSLVYPADAPLAEKLTLETIVAAPVPGNEVRQGFRIHEVTTTLDGLLEVTAFHVFYDLAGNFIADTFVVNKTAKVALDQLLHAATTPHGFTATSSDTATRATARLVRMSLASALMDTGQDNTFASRWAGEITRDNWHIHHSAQRGQDRGVVIRDRKNLTGYQSVVDLTSVVTRVVPVGYDGITLPELYIDSPKLDAYVTPRIRVIRYPHIKAINDPERPGEDEVPLDDAHTLLREAAHAEFTKGRVDEPAASYTVSFVELATTKEYADFADLETVILGDTVTVRHADLGVALTARVVGYGYDPLTRTYVSVELGSVAGKFTSITRQITSAVNAAEVAQDLAGVALASADGKTTNHYGPIHPATARLGDTWFRDNGENVEIWVYQITDTGEPGWVALATDLNHAQVTAELATARAEVEAAQQAADEAKATATAVSTRMDLAEADIDQARQAAMGAEAKAAEAELAADEAAAQVEQYDELISQAHARADEAYQSAAQTYDSSEAWFLQLTNADQDLSSSLSMLSNDLNLRVKAGELISQINLSPETILISGSRIHISGATTIDEGTIMTAMIANAAITDAKIASLSASKITTGTLAAARIAAGSITSDKLTIASGFIKTAMIADAAVTSAKIAALDAGKITTGTLSAARIGAGSITADKLATNAIQVGLAGWNSSIRISPTQIGWYSGTSLEGTITSAGLKFWYGTRYIGEMARRAKKDAADIQGIVNQLAYRGDYIAWSYQTTSSGDYYTCLTLDPKGRFYGRAGIHLGADLRMNGNKVYTSDTRYVMFQDVTFTGKGTYATLSGSNGLARIGFHTYDLLVTTNGTFYNMSRLFDRVKDLMTRVNSLIGRLNYGWIVSISGSGSNITWKNYANTGLSTMSTTLA